MASTEKTPLNAFTRICEACRQTFEAKRRWQRFCSNRCRCSRWRIENQGEVIGHLQGMEIIARKPRRKP